jgi:outer membrane protein OmpA-like peptidoglycan-associated protein
MKKLLATALIISTLTGCAAMQNEDGSTNKTAMYGGSGALLGGVAGALLGGKNKGKGALIGAAVAGSAAAGYGYYVDKQEAELRNKMKGSGVQIERNGDELKLVMPGSITFATGKSEIQPSFYSTLNQLASNFGQFPQSDLVITGNTDSVGSYETNKTLSARRADSVAQYLEANGVSASRVRTVGAGSSVPVASNDTADGRAQNRRVEIKLVPRPSVASQN